MTKVQSLTDMLDDSVRRWPDKVALVVPNLEQITYAQLGTLSDRVRDRLCALGIMPGDRVALYLHKSAAAVAAIFGILKSGAAYVPIDADGPRARADLIMENCSVRAVIAERRLEEEWGSNLEKRGTYVLALDGSSANSLESLLSSLQDIAPAPATATRRSGPDDVAYILHTSGSTGTPKGVTLTHANALSFIGWCSETFDVRPDDRLSSHAPFHFDLSIFDIYMAIKYGCTLVLIDEALGKEVARLASAISTQRITVWYSTPSILVMLATYGKLQLHDYSGLRLVLFAGEPLAVTKYLALRRFWSHTRCFNLYGPTETNVCTWYELPSDEHVVQMDSIPIGKMCYPNVGMMVDDKDNPVSHGQGELLVHGPNVMRGYWSRPENDAAAFMVDAANRKWYRTGDIVVQDQNAGYIYVGRRDRMVKRRGYRIELGDIEAALLRVDVVQEAAVVAVPDEESGVKIVAFVAQGAQALGDSAWKAAALTVLPRYMIPDKFVPITHLPRTSTDKVNYQELKQSVAK